MKTLAVLALLVGCASSDDGAAPSIAALTYSPMTVPVNQQTTVTGSFTFTDDDGDAAELGIEITLPDNSTQALPKTALQNVGDMTSGSIAFAVLFAPPTAGTYKFGIFITDDGDHDSNKLTGTLTAN